MTDLPTGGAVVAIIGTGERVQNVYLPILGHLDCRVSGIVGRDSDKSKAVAARNQTHAYRSIDEALSDTEAEAYIVAVDWLANPTLYRTLLEVCRQPILLETPVANTELELEGLVHVLQRRRGYVAVAEQYALRPAESLMAAAARAGLLGEVAHARVDGHGHEYHGFAVLRSLLATGREVPRVQAVERDLPLIDSPLHGPVFFPGERLQLATLEYRAHIGLYAWSWLSYRSPIRPRRAASVFGSRGYLENGSGIVLRSSGAGTENLRMVPRTAVRAGLEVIQEVALIGENGSAVARWNNPVPEAPLPLDVAVCARFVRDLILAARRGDQAHHNSVAEALTDTRTLIAFRAATARADAQGQPDAGA